MAERERERKREREWRGGRVVIERKKDAKIAKGEGGRRGRAKGRHRRIGRIIEWYVTVLCRFARNVGAVSELMAAGQMFRGFSAELSCPRAQHNAGDSVCACFRHVYGCNILMSYVTHAYLANIATRCAVHTPPAESASDNVYITCTVAVAQLGYKYPV